MAPFTEVNKLMNIFAHISNKDAFCGQFHHLLSSVQYKEKKSELVLKKKPMQRRKLFLGEWYISAGQTSLFQV